MRPPNSPRLTVALPRRLVLATALFLSVVVAKAVSISPVLVELSPTRRITSITFSNPGDEAISFQTKTLAWSQVDGIDQYAPTSDLIVAPPIAEIAAGSSQIFRVALRGPATGHEQAYRLIFEDVTAAMAADPGHVGITVRINHDLPVFVSAAGEPQARLRMGPCVGRPAGVACVRIDNSGERYAQIKTLSVERGTWQKEFTVNARILAGAWRQWDLEVPAGSTGMIHVSTLSAAGVISAEIASSPN